MTEAYTFQKFPMMIYRADAHLIVADDDELKAAVADGWRTFEQLRSLDGDGDGKPGGSLPKGQAKPGELTDAEINADLEAMGIEPDPTVHKSTRLKQRNAARAAR